MSPPARSNWPRRPRLTSPVASSTSTVACTGPTWKWGSQTSDSKGNGTPSVWSGRVQSRRRRGRKTTCSAPPRAAAPGCRFDPVIPAGGAPPVNVGAADVLAVSGRPLRAAPADKRVRSTSGAEARRELEGWGGHERSVRAPAAKGNGMNERRLHRGKEAFDHGVVNGGVHAIGARPFMVAACVTLHVLHRAPRQHLRPQASADGIPAAVDLRRTVLGCDSNAYLRVERHRLPGRLSGRVAKSALLSGACNDRLAHLKVRGSSAGQPWWCSS
jgi:hypothetical protein